MASADILNREGRARTTANAPAARRQPLRIVHYLRAPAGGMLRHVCDLAEAQAEAGHSVGIVCDATTIDAISKQLLDRVEPKLALGIKRLPMVRDTAPSGFTLTARLLSAVRALNPDVLHTHGSRGGATGRIVGTILRASGMSVARIYTPHGEPLQFDRRSAKGRVHFALERVLARMTDGFVMTSHYEADVFAARVGATRAPRVVALNGLRPEAFTPVQRASDARDFLFIGELSELEGPDVFLRALALIRDRSGHAPGAFVVGQGPDKTRYETLASELGLTMSVTFLDPMAARTAFRLAHTMVLPSRNESLPYVVLEALAAGMPVVATRVGGVPEIFGADAGRLVPPGDPIALANAMSAAYAAPVKAVQATVRLKEGIRRRFSVAAMAATVEDAYGLALAR